MTRAFTENVYTELNDKIYAILGSRLDAFNGNTIIERLLDKFVCPEQIFYPDDGDLLDFIM